MIHFQIPRNSPTLYKYIQCTNTENIPEPVISHSLSHYLGDIKQRIDHQEHEWDLYKRYTNPYEYIHTNIPGKRKSICKYKPLSRSYFKMIELIQFFRLLDMSKDMSKDISKDISKPNNTPYKSFHLAEGPGGFIEALISMRNNKSDEYVGMTIIDSVSDPNIPAWKKSQQFLCENPNVYIEVGCDKTGDILSIANFIHCREKYGSKMDLITADGGFDFSIDFNSQENHIAKLLFGQIVYALCMQKRGGHFILKVFDCFMQHTLDALAILSSFYEKVYITKPQTSRYANSEKYIVCKGFLFDEETVHTCIPFLHKAFDKMISQTDCVKRSNGYGDDLSNVNILRFLSIPLSITFLTRMEEYNAIFGQQQIENIYHTLSFIENKYKQERIDSLVKLNIQKCVNWCIKHNVVHFTEIPNIMTNDHTYLEGNVGVASRGNYATSFNRNTSQYDETHTSINQVNINRNSLKMYRKIHLERAGGEGVLPTAMNSSLSNGASRSFLDEILYVDSGALSKEFVQLSGASYIKPTFVSKYRTNKWVNTNLSEIHNNSEGV